MTAENERPITDEDAVIAEMPGLRVEVGHTEDLIVLQQASSSGPASRIALHKWQVRMLAGYMGLLKTGGPSLSESKVIALLARRLRVMHERSDHLSHFLHHHSDSEHADLDYEQTYSLATCQIADEYVADLDDLVQLAGGQRRTDLPAAAAGATAPDAQKGLL